MTLARIGDWMQTFTGRQFWPLDPRAEEIFIEDIAHSLSMQCRYAGHSILFYSVAEHSVLLSQNAPADLQLWALLHDAAEAYILDVIRPLKPNLPGYVEAEAHVMVEVCARFGLPFLMPKEVKRLDGAILRDEAMQNMAPCVTPWTFPEPEPLGVKLQFWTPAQAEAEFLRAFYSLTGSVNHA